MQNPPRAFDPTSTCETNMKDVLAELKDLPLSDEAWLGTWISYFWTGMFDTPLSVLVTYMKTGARPADVIVDKMIDRTHLWARTFVTMYMAHWPSAKQYTDEEIEQMARAAAQPP